MLLDWEKMLDLLIYRYGIDINFDGDYCIENNCNGAYSSRDRTIYLSEPIGLAEETFWHEATHALQYLFMAGEPLGFPATTKGENLWQVYKRGYAPEKHDIEAEAFYVQCSKTYKAILLELAEGEFPVRLLKKVCIERLS
jgi:hypothetical protein